MIWVRKLGSKFPENLKVKRDQELCETAEGIRGHTRRISRWHMRNWRDFGFLQIRAPIMEGEVCADITAYYSIPRSATKKRRALMEANEVRPTKKPDADNVSKIILDALNGLAYHDDSQVVELTVKKKFALYPRVDVVLWLRDDA